MFAERATVEEVELGAAFAPRFDDRGLLPVIVPTLRAAIR